MERVMKTIDTAKIFSEVCAYPENANVVVPDSVAIHFFPGTSLKTFQRNCPAPVVNISERKKGRQLKHLRALVRGETIA
jgi:hypothetical protein